MLRLNKSLSLLAAVAFIANTAIAQNNNSIENSGQPHNTQSNILTQKVRWYSYRCRIETTNARCGSCFVIQYPTECYNR